MAKTLLKMVLGVLLLSGIFFFMLQLWEKNHSQPTTTPATSETAASSISDISVSDAPEGATIEIKNITGSTYSVSKEEKGFYIDFPEAKVTLANKEMKLPHPLIESIETTETGTAGQNGAKVKVSLVTAATFNTRQSNGSLFVDITREKEAVAEPAPPVKEKPVKAHMKKGKQGKSKKHFVGTKKSTKKSTRKQRQQDDFDLATAEPAPAPKMKQPKAPAPKTEEDKFLSDLGITDSNASPPAATGGEEIPQVPEIPAGGAEPPPASNNDLFASGPQNTGQAPLDKNFDSSQITANLPPVTELTVVVEGGITKVRVTRAAKTKYKIFPKRNPNRIVIEFQNAVNQLPAELGSFAGTRVDRVVTSQFVGPEGTICRIELFLNAVPDVNRGAVVNSATLFELPIP